MVQIIPITKIHFKALEIIRRYDMVQKDFALSVIAYTYDDQPAGEVKELKPKIRIEYHHREMPLHAIAFAEGDTDTLVLEGFDTAIIEASKKMSGMHKN